MYMKDTLDAPAKKRSLVKSDASKGGGRRMEKEAQRRDTDGKVKFAINRGQRK